MKIMNKEIIFEIIKLLVMFLALVVYRYVIPWLRSKISADKFAEIEKWAKYAVLKAQQVMYA
ncbi:MAG: phage holin family protein, partial [Lachnospiraceae bacterium]|nr:phage holin family protein [Lachnospiraceae bacterium]